ncbi:LacI family DNA-binding transcriptional regulator [Marinomonas communis]|jgi:LacI family transcriptional regulator|uniref:LacI family transcriptional regulator n=1 Tax=Marinomonas communis TaxID=28254 RepID=A0A4R6X154_9GAMM|nr:LacI family DNA-binding transcriptional regulator [Marinomonas communis]MCC4273236.1 LacI family DNA-binding transcriptional regulator [Marinomonas communis]TDR12546.1 LacI family transcriptional regulator [Marinomonas communis]
MSNRPTIEDLAAAAGVSTATVDRVLNKRSKVREVTAQRVLLAAEDIGYHAAGLLKQRVRESKPRKRLSILLQRSNDEFYVALGKAIEAACSRATDFVFETTIRFMDEVSPEYITEQLERESQHADAMAVVALDHLLLNQEVERITGQNIPVLTLLSPLSTSTCTRHIGVDNRKAGRTAAWAINRLAKPGDVGILLGSHSYLNQDIAEISFISYFREIQHDFNLLAPQVNLDDNQLAYQATKDLIAQAPNISAIYSAGGGVEGIIKAIREAQKAQSITLICNELMSSTRLALSDGCIDMIIATPVSKIAQAVVETFTQALSQKHITPQPALQLTVELHVAENL